MYSVPIYRDKPSNGAYNGSDLPIKGCRRMGLGESFVLCLLFTRFGARKKLRLSL